MDATTVLLLGPEQDEHIQHMLAYLQQRKLDAEVFDSRWFPQQMQLTFDPRSGQWQIQLPTGRHLFSDEIRAVYWRSYEGVGAVELPNPDQSFLAQNDSRSLFESLLIYLPARWVNSWTAFQLHQTKPVQLAIASQVGLRTPATCFTNCPEELLRFASTAGTHIFKPVQGGDLTRPLALPHLTRENLERLRLSPITAQKLISGTNVRVFVAGQRVVACEVRTAHLDYREDPRPALLVHSLPTAIADDCQRLARELHLLWTGIDFRLTPDGAYVFLEANPSPMFLGFEAGTGLPLTEMLGELLM